MLAMYVGMIFTLWSFFAPLWQQDLPELLYEEMIYPDRVLKLCMEIYQCRIFEEIELELELSLKLIGIFCNPNKLEVWTRPPKEQDEPDHSATLPQIV
ncbi:hypothetical protein B566_EDAN008935 [Ephemera danica]|nr:hypothetical protein B566_EDAN008935 [Ephemera danica]